MAFRPLSSLIPTAAELLALEVEELAGVLLVHLKSYEGVPGNTAYQNGLFSPTHLLSIMNATGYGPQRKEREYGEKQPEVNRAVMEAWAWLEKEGFLIRAVEQPAPWFWMSRRAERIKTQGDFESYRKASLLPSGQLHPLIAARTYPAFLRGEYDTAIFQAFREVEVAVRRVGDFPQDLVGDKLMRAAFAPMDNGAPGGPLTDAKVPITEQKAMAHLFAGAFGVYRNSTGHRHVPAEPHAAAEVIMFASHLLRIVDESVGSAQA